MKQSNDNRYLLEEIRKLLDSDANILADSYLRRLDGKLTILYLRISREDKLGDQVSKDNKDESNSISNQRIYLTNYSKKNKFKNVMVFFDDGVSGVTFDRDDFKKFCKIPICEHLWRHQAVKLILTNRSYVGDVVNFKTYSKSFKLRQRLDNPEEKWEIYKNAHDAIIERQAWEDIQKSFDGMRYKKPKHTEKHIFAGLLKCSDCGANLNYKYIVGNDDNSYFSCKNNRSGEGLCKKTHHIRVDKLTELLTNRISSIVSFANCFEDMFVKMVMDENYKMVVASQKRNQNELQKLLLRDKEIDTLVEKLFEEKVLGNLSNERFLKLSGKYDEEQFELKAKIKNLENIVYEEKSHKLNIDVFLQRVHKYSDIKKLTPEILHELIDKVVVHHREQIEGQTIQKIEIYYKMIGKVEIPHMSKSEKEKYLKIFGANKDKRSA